MTPHLQRALVLFEQGRPALAEEELRRSLAQDPGDPLAHALLGLCLLESERFDEAEREARTAVGADPGFPFAHHALGSVLHRRRRLDEAEASADEALRLDPSDASSWALRASLRFDRRDWKGALESADQGLAQDPRHSGCANLRALALVKLGRKEEASAGLDFALARDPEDALTHANQGWALLHQGRPDRALEHFREALRLDPSLDHARAGIVEALKARNPVYGLMLRYFLWSSRLGRGAQWAVLIGGVMLRSTLADLASRHAWALPLLLASLAFVLMTWLAVPLFNLALRLNRFGRLALSEDQVRASTWVGGTLFCALLGLGLWLAAGWPLALLAGLGFALLLIPVSGTFGCDPGWPRTAMAIYTGVLALVGLGALFREGLGGIFVIGAVLSSWAGVWLSSVRPRR